MSLHLSDDAQTVDHMLGFPQGHGTILQYLLPQFFLFVQYRIIVCLFFVHENTSKSTFG